MTKKIKFFDLIILFFAAIVVLFFAYYFFRKTSYVTTTIKVGDETVQYDPWQISTGQKSWFSQLFKEGMKEQDGFGRAVAEVVSVNYFDTQPNFQSIFLTVKLKTVYNRASDQNTFKGTPVLIGSPIKLNLDSLYIKGVIIDIEGVVDSNTTKEDILIEAQLIENNPTFPNTDGVKPYIANSITIGEEMKDNQNQIIAKIIDKKVTPATTTTTTSTGRILAQNDPVRKKVTLTISISASKNGSRYFMHNDIPILIGERVLLHFPTLTIYPTITNIIIK